MRSLYPELNNNFSAFLQNDPIHTVYYEESGNPNGIPVVFLHGGPGSGCNDNHRRYFDPKAYRIILVDQRGCHRSTPQGGIDNNTTQHILSDLERIRQTLAIDKWVVFGGSWGSTLALLYAEQFPGSVMGLILRGSFLARHQDLDWFLNGVTRIFPDYWNDVRLQYSGSNAETILNNIASDVFSSDAASQLKAAKTWALWAGRIVTSSITNDYQLESENTEKLIHETRIEMHYAMHRYFIEENQILNHIDKIPDVPITLIHGRRDLTCLPDSSWSLHQAIPKSNFILLPETGHLGSETAMIDALITATDTLATELAI